VLYFVIISLGAAAISKKCNNKFISFLTVSNLLFRSFLPFNRVNKTLF
jgi:hypothetical protein